MGLKHRRYGRQTRIHKLFLKEKYSEKYMAHVKT
jgi:hypothetical protein